jgi:hypothetical protein
MQFLIERYINNILPMKHYGSKNYTPKITLIELSLFTCYIRYVKHTFIQAMQEQKLSNEQEELIQFVDICLDSISVSSNLEKQCYLPDYLSQCIYRVENQLLLLHLVSHIQQKYHYEKEEFELLMNEAKQMIKRDNNVEHTQQLMHRENVHKFTLFLSQQITQELENRKKRKEEQRRRKQIHRFRLFLNAYRRKLMKDRASISLNSYLLQNLVTASISARMIK